MHGMSSSVISVPHRSVEDIQHTKPLIKQMPGEKLITGMMNPPDVSGMSWSSGPVGGAVVQTSSGLSSTATPAATPPSACSELLVLSRWPTHSLNTMSLPFLCVKMLQLFAVTQSILRCS